MSRNGADFELGANEVRDVDLRLLPEEHQRRHLTGIYAHGGPEPSVVQELITSGGGFTRYHGFRADKV